MICHLHPFFTQQVVASGGPYTSDHTYDISYCLYPGRYTFVFYDWQCDGLEGVEMNGFYTLKNNGEEVHTGGTKMDEYWETFDMEFKMDVVEAPAKAPDSSGTSKMSGWMVVVTMAAALPAMVV